MGSSKTINPASRPKATRIYLREADEYVGPFCKRRDAERFLELMELFGESSEGIEVIELEVDSRAPKPRRQKPGAATNPGMTRCDCRAVNQ